MKITRPLVLAGLATLGLATSACGVSRNTYPFSTDGATGEGGGAGAFDLASHASTDLATQPSGDPCAMELTGCYTVYAHSDHVLYKLDLKNQLIVELGPFNAPMVSGKEDSITDLAVAPDDTIYAISRTNLYTADKTDGHVTLVSPVGACGGYAVALTFTADGKLYAGDHKGAFCRIDLSVTPPTVSALGMIGGGLGIAGDLVAVGDGTMYGTVYTIADTTSESNNTLVKIDPATGAVTQVIGPTGFPRLFGVAYDGGQVFGFTYDGSGKVVTIDPKTGVGTLFGTFTDPNTGKGISFAGAGVNAKVAATIQ
jgi:DNA-binding beta-propeller fold protein YncE